MSDSESARSRLQQSLLRLSRVSAAGASAPARSRAPRKPLATATPTPVAPDIPVRGPDPEPDSGPTASEMAAELNERLDRIEELLADLTRPVRPIPATREIFAEWVRLRKWEELEFGDFLRLRRSGVV